jgi:integrase
VAHIRRHPVDSSKWQVRYIDPAGRERSKTFRRKVDAEKYLIHIEAQKQRAEWINPELSATPFGEWAARWLATRSHLKPKTRAGYESLFRAWVLPAFGNTRLDRIEPMAVEAWIVDMGRAGLSASRIRQAHQALSAPLKAAVRNRYLASNPAAGVSLPRARRKEQRFLDAQQLDDLAQAIAEPYSTFVYLLGYGGLRWGEATALRRRRIDVLRARVEIAESVAEVGGKLMYGPTKTYRSRTVTLPRSLRDMLNTHLTEHVAPGPDALVFTATGRTYKTTTTNPGTPLRNTNFTQRVWKPAVTAAGLRDGLRIHDLRHTAAALMIAAGAHPEHIKRHLGHSSIMVTMDLYGHLLPSEAEEIADRLDDMLRGSQTDKRRTKPLEVAKPEDREASEDAPDQGFFEWA